MPCTTGPCPAMQYESLACTSSSDRQCDFFRSAQNCSLDSWSSWSDCTIPCDSQGGGRQFRTRNVLVNGLRGGKECNVDPLVEIPNANQTADATVVASNDVMELRTCGREACAPCPDNNNCNVLENPCFGDPCGPHATQCEADKFTCSCEAGYTGLTCDEDINECLNPTVCQNGGQCTNMDGGFSCTCPSHFAGATCHCTNCTALSQITPSFTTSLCGLTNTSRVSSCQSCDTCATGQYTTESCRVGDILLGVGSNTKCSDCDSCASGFFTSNPCANGSALVLGQNTACAQCTTCLPWQYELQACDQGSIYTVGSDTNCTNCPQGNCFSQDHVRCTTAKDITCLSCQNGFWGFNCTSICNLAPQGANHCSINSTTLPDGAPGFYGCDQKSGAFEQCLAGCQPGWTGATCSSECALAGNCAVSDLVRTCDQNTGIPTECLICKAGFWGADCSLECSLGGCAQVLACNQSTGEDRVCNGCQDGYFGDNCQFTGDPCISNPCADGSTCSSNGPVFSCECPDGFEGTSCEVNIDDCPENACQNGGTCVDGIESFTCDCPLGFSGSSCEVGCSILSCFPDDEVCFTPSSSASSAELLTQAAAVPECGAFDGCSSTNNSIVCCFSNCYAAHPRTLAPSDRASVIGTVIKSEWPFVYTFNGVDSGLRLPTLNFLTDNRLPRDSLTLYFTLRVPSTSNGRLIVYNDKSDTGKFIQITIENNVLKFRYRTLTDRARFHTNTFPNNNNWLMMMVTISSTQMRTYIDNVLAIDITLDIPVSLTTQRADLTSEADPYSFSVGQGNSPTLPLGRNHLEFELYPSSAFMILGTLETSDTRPFDLLRLGVRAGDDPPTISANNEWLSFSVNEEGYVQAPAQNSLSNRSFSIGMTFRRASATNPLPSLMTLLSKHVSGAGSRSILTIGIGSTGSIFFRMFDGSGAIASGTFPLTVDTEWHRVLFVVEDNGVVNTYVNGNFVGVVGTPGKFLLDDVSADAEMLIGRGADDNNPLSFDGDIYQCQLFFDRVTDAQIELPE
eukprot:m.174900 g.174900  ORF g.174900 m.174900 type:complete len:1022 (+) comp25288_c0_seq3:249-3314(+)